MKAGLWIIAFVRKAGEFDISFVWNEREKRGIFQAFVNLKIGKF